MTDDIHIQQFQIADLEQLLSFLRTAYPSEARKCESAFWRWQFLENPNIQSGEIPVWVAKFGEQIVGQIAAIPVVLKIADRETQAIWIVDLIVSAEHRGKGLGKRLMLAAKEYCPTVIALGFNELSGAILRSLNYSFIGGLHRYHLMLYPGNAVREISKYRALRNIVNFIYTPFHRRIVSRTDDKSKCVLPVTRFDASLDDLWNRARSQWRCAVGRDSAFLKWQFIKQPGKKFEILGAYEQERLVGCIVLFFRKPEHGDASEKAAITDMIYDSGCSFDVIDILLKAAIRLAIERRAGSLVADVLDERIEKRLQTLGFWRIKNAPQFMASANEHKDLINDARNWFLTRADSDVSIFEMPNV